MLEIDEDKRINIVDLCILCGLDIIIKNRITSPYCNRFKPNYS